MRTQILVVDDQPATSRLIADLLGEEKKYEVAICETLASARETLARRLPDLLILDLSLPDGNGLDLCRELRASPTSKSLPVLILTAKTTVEDKVSGLTGGADDYLTKPFSPQELIARVDALLRRSATVIEEPSVQSAGDLRMDRRSRRVYVKSREIPLSNKEFDLLWLLATKRNEVLSREILLQRAWGYESGLDLNTKVVDVTLSHLREKLGEAASVIVAVRGLGYRLDAPAQ
jgi:DNA-binding response OmpR family regulator